MPTNRRVFLSHTSEFADYPKSRSYVDHAKDACNLGGFLFGDMSLWSAAAMPPAEVCRRRVRGCQVYIGIIGLSYGSPVPAEPGLSYTELEFEEARSLGLPVLAFLLADDGDMPPGLAIGDAKYAKRQRRFRRRLRSAGLTVPFFRNPDHLSKLIGDALRDLADQDSEPETPGAVMAVTPGRPAPKVQSRPALFMAGHVAADTVRRSELDELCDHIRASARETTMGSSNIGSLTTVLVGPGGFGKTTLADSACHELRDQFPDGVLRVEFGEEPTEQLKIGWCRDLVLALGEDCPPFSTAAMAGIHLGRVLSGRRVLLVLDDVWRRSDLEPFFQRGSSTVLLITTRDRDTAPAGANVIGVEQLSDSHTQQILTAGGLDAQAVDWSELIRRSGRWPLLASLVNGVLVAEVKRGRAVSAAVAELTTELAERGPAVLDPLDPDESRRAIAATVELSIARLQRGRRGTEAADRYRSLAIFPESVDVPLQLLAGWWGISLFEGRRLAQTLLHLSLIESYDAGIETVRLHDVLREYLWFEFTSDDRRALHLSFLAAHRPRTEDWADLSGYAKYLWRWAAVHLREAGRSDELVSTLRNVSYLAKKVRQCGTPAVLDDLALAADSDARERRAWFRRYSHLLEGLPSSADVVATLMARPGAGVLVDTAPKTGPLAPGVRYARGWSCPEPAVTALDRVLGTHQRRVQACEWSPNGRLLASVDGDGFVQLLDCDGHRQPLEIGTDGWVLALAWSPDGQLLATGDDDGLVETWAVDDTARNLHVGRHNIGARVVAWSPDGERIASGGDDAVRVWPARGGTELANLRREGWWVRALAWSPDGHSLACAYDDGAVGTWAPGRPGRFVKLGRHDGGAFAVGWSNDGRRVISGGRDGVVRLWPVQGDGLPVELDSGISPVWALALSADGILASGSGDGALRVWTLNGDAKPMDLGRHEGGVLTVSWRPDDGALASGGRDGALRLWQVTGAGNGADRANDPVLSVGWSTDGRWLASGTRGGCVNVWNSSGSGEREPLIRHDVAVTAVAWSLDGLHLASGGDDGRVVIHDAQSSADILEFDATGGSVRKLAWSPGQSRLASIGGDGTVQIWRLDAENGVAVGRHGEWVRAMAWAPDGARFATGDDSGRLQLWDLQVDPEPVELGRRDERGVRTIAWSPDGLLLAIGRNDGSVWLWGPDDDPVQLGGHRDEVQDLAWSPDGSEVASVGGDSVLRIWRASTVHRVDNRLRCTLALDGALSSLAWHPDGELLVVAGTHGLYVLEVAGQLVDVKFA